MTTAREVMASPIITIDCTENVRKAAKMMSEYSIGSLLVKCSAVGCPKCTPAFADVSGIITERDLLKRTLAVGRNPDETIVRDIMTTSLLTIDADSSIDEATEVLLKNNISRLPVVEGGNIIGLVSYSNLLNKIRHARAHRIKKEYSRPDYERSPPPIDKHGRG
ncbi:Inosine-5'-monophosphate dehydrogenase [uncultured archaeon]|nr:Inosine-5'-monophosphate dehydrogenase [uncultured archaeon]